MNKIWSHASLILCCVSIMGFHAPEVHADDKTKTYTQEEAVAWVKERGGWFEHASKKESVVVRIGFNSLAFYATPAKEVTDITRLKDLQDLEYLNLSDTDVSDFSPLQGLKNLQTLV
ncbi:MAG: hypothetical protein N2C14_05860, partial [Planctomycetales bacterium]